MFPAGQVKFRLALLPVHFSRHSVITKERFASLALNHPLEPVIRCVQTPCFGTQVGPLCTFRTRRRAKTRGSTLDGVAFAVPPATI